MKQWGQILHQCHLMSTLRWLLLLSAVSFSTATNGVLLLLFNDTIWLWNLTGITSRAQHHGGILIPAPTPTPQAFRKHWAHVLAGSWPHHSTWFKEAQKVYGKSINISYIYIYIYFNVSIYGFVYGRFISILKMWTSSTAQGGGGSFKYRKPIGEIGGCESPMAEQKHWCNCPTV